MESDKSHLALYGLGAVALVVIIVLFTKAQSSSSGSISTGTAQTVGAIVGANENAQSLQASENIARATLGEKLLEVQSNNDAALALAATNNATQVQLTKIAADATVQESQSLASANEAEAALANKTATTQSNNELQAAKAQASAQKNSSIFGTIGNILSSAIPFLKL